MKYLKMLALLALVVGTSSAFAGTASATVATSPSGTAYTGEIHGSSFGSVEFHGSFTTVKCASSTIRGAIESHGASTTARGNLTLGGGFTSFSLCNFPVRVLSPGSLEFHAIGGGNATVTSSGLELTFETSIGSCLFRTLGTDIGTLTSWAGVQLDLNSAALPRTGHSIFCGSTATWTGSYTFSPSSLSFD